MNKTIRIVVSSAIAYMPLLAFAEGKDLNYLIALAADYLNKALLLLMGLAVLLFVWYVIKFFIRPSDKDRAEGAQYLMWSIVGFFVILSFWGLVNVLENTFNLDDNRPSSWSDFMNIFPRDTGGRSGTSR